MSEGKFTIDALGIGDAMVDLTTFAPSPPPLGGNVWGTAVSLSPGGTTANIAANLARLGLRSAFAGCVGDDPYGRYIMDVFAKDGVDCDDVMLDYGAFTGIVLAIVNDSGERTFIACAKGAAHSRLTQEHISGMDFSRTHVVHISGVCLVEEPSRQASLQALQKAKMLNIPVYYDPNLRLEGEVFPEELRKAQRAAMSAAGIVLIGEEELALIYDTKEISEGAAIALASGSDLVVVKRGAKGVSAFWAGGHYAMLAFKVDALDTTGAGDAFDAGFIAARLRGLELHETLTYASAVAALKVTQTGSRSIPTHAEVQAFLKKLTP